MPISFKKKKTIRIIRRTPEDQRQICSECGGLQAVAQTSIRMDCPVCDGTGYENFYTSILAEASYRPGTISRWNYVQGALDFAGECSIKLDYRYKPIIDSASFIEMDGIQWKFTFLRNPGEAMGQQRMVLALSRK